MAGSGGGDGRLKLIYVGEGSGPREVMGAVTSPCLEAPMSGFMMLGAGTGWMPPAVTHPPHPKLALCPPGEWEWEKLLQLLLWSIHV